MELSGSGTDVRFVELVEGQHVVEMSVSGNGYLGTIGVAIGDLSTASAFGDEWSGSSLVTVGGNEYGRIPPGRTAVEVEVSPGASWSLRFVNPSPTLSADDVISGQGQDVKFVDLTEGDWVVEITVDGNRVCVTSSSCADGSFDIDIGGDSVVFEIAETWSGRHLISVGDSFDQISPGSVALEVRAEVEATWSLVFLDASTLPVLDSREPLSGSGTDVRFVELVEGQHVVEMSVSGNGYLGTIGVAVGDLSIASAFGDEWSGSSLVTIGGDGYGRIPPGRTAVEVEVSPEASWSLRFVDLPPTLSADDVISGQGQDVKFVDLTDGDWVVEITVDDNRVCITSSSCTDGSFDIDIGGDSVVFEIAETWSGRHLISVGDSFDQISPGSVALEVRAEVEATWSMQFMRP